MCVFLAIDDDRRLGEGVDTIFKYTDPNFVVQFICVYSQLLLAFLPHDIVAHTSDNTVLLFFIRSIVCILVTYTLKLRINLRANRTMVSYSKKIL